MCVQIVHEMTNINIPVLIYQTVVNLHRSTQVRKSVSSVIYATLRAGSPPDRNKNFYDCQFFFCISETLLYSRCSTENKEGSNILRTLPFDGLTERKIVAVFTGQNESRQFWTPQQMFSVIACYQCQQCLTTKGIELK